MGGGPTKLCIFLQSLAFFPSFLLQCHAPCHHHHHKCHDHASLTTTFDAVPLWFSLHFAEPSFSFVVQFSGYLEFSFSAHRTSLVLLSRLHILAVSSACTSQEASGSYNRIYFACMLSWPEVCQD